MMQSIHANVNAINTYKNAVINSAHNIANIDTPYFKSNSLQLSDLKQGGVNVAAIRQNQSQSYTIQSGRTLDFVIEGEGQFKLDAGERDHFTRNGKFYLDAEGSIVDSKGRVLLEDVVRPDENIDDYEITEKGEFIVNREYRGKIDIFDSYGNKIPEEQYRVKSGMIEVSDVDYAKEVVDMIAAENAISANYAAVKTFDELTGLIVDLVS